jgi:hypothetical protein
MVSACTSSLMPETSMAQGPPSANIAHDGFRPEED